MDDDPVLRELLSTWEQGLVQGRDQPASELCRDRPDLANELDRRIEEVRRLNKRAMSAAAGIVPTPFDQVVAACESFTVDWKPDAESMTGPYLNRVDADALTDFAAKHAGDRR